MKKNTQLVNGLDIQKEYISVVQYAPEENSVVLVAIQPLATGKTDTLWTRTSSALLELKNKFKFNTSSLICSVPSEFAVIKKIPVDNEASQIEELLEWELSQQVIGALDDYAVDFQEGGIFGNQTQRELLTVAYRKSHLSEISTTLKTLKLKPTVVDLDLFSVVNAFEANYKELISQPIVIVHAESEKTKLIMTQDGLYIDTDMFDYEYGSLEEETYAHNLENVFRKFVSLNKQFLGTEPSLFLTGSVFGQETYINAVVNRVGNGELLNPFRSVRCQIGTDDNQIMTYASQLTVALGLALRGNE